MPTLANVQGSSLVPNLDQALEIALGAISRKRARDEAEVVKQEELERQEEIDRQINILTSGSQDPQAEEAALLRLGAIDPALANATRATIQRGDEQEIDALRQTAEQGARDSVLVSSQPDFASKQAAIGQLASQAAVRGEPLDRFIQLQNMSEPELDLELQRMQIAAQDIDTLLKPVEAIKPTTATGKARQDLNAGLITQAEFDAITSTPLEFQTDVGKLIADRQLAVDLFKEGSEQVKAIDAAIESDQKGEAPNLSDVGGVRKEFTKLSGDFIKLRDAIGKVRLAADNPSAAGDLSLIFNFMKILDPGSTVREGEFATAQNSAGIPDRIRGKYNQVVNGEKLAAGTRDDFVNTANRMFEGQTDRQRQLENSFTALATSQDMKPGDVIIDFIGEETVEPDGTVTIGGQSIPVGTIITNSAGQQGRIEADGSITLIQ